MNGNELGKLGVSDTRPPSAGVEQQRQAMLLPPYIRQPTDSNSPEHQLACLAWRLMSTKTEVGLEVFLKTQKPQARLKLQPFLIKAKAWIWLQTMTEPQIRRGLNFLKNHEMQPMRQALNELQAQEYNLNATEGKANA